MGNLGRALVFGTIYMGILTEPCIFHYMTVESLQQVGDLCFVALRCVQCSDCIVFNRVRYRQRPASSTT